MKMNPKTILLIFAIFFLTGCNEETEIVEKQSAKIVKILNLSQISHKKTTFEYPAQIEAFQDTTMAFEVSGKIVEFNFSEGEMVKKGEVIASLDDTIYQANYNSAKASYLQAQAELERDEKLLKINAISQSNYEKQKQNFAIAKSAFEVAQKNLQETKLKAEFDGTIAKKLINDYARITAKQQIVILQDISSFKVKIFVPEDDMSQTKGTITPQSISKHLDIFVTLGNNDSKKYQASLLNIATTADKVTRTFEVTLKIEKQKDTTILPGMTAKVIAILKDSNQPRISIPYKAVFTSKSKNPYVWIVNSENKVNRKKIVLGNLTGDSVEVVSGLDESMRIVTSGVRFLQENDEVKEYKKLDN